MTIGPSLPPHIAKRSRGDDNDDAPSPDTSDKRRRVLGPAPPPSASSPPRVAGPSLPPQSRSRPSSEDSDVGPAPLPASKPARVVGPAAPPAPLDERPPDPPSDEDSDSSDDDFGPAPPPAGATYTDYDNEKPAANSAFDTDPQYTEGPIKAERDAWMTMPPTQDDLGRMDPSKVRARKFNTGKSAGQTGTGGGIGVWTETPEQKLKRLQDEALGITAPANSASSKKESRRVKEEEEKARRLREKLDAARGKSLVEQHKEKSGKEEEDDPSRRVFDYEKDMAVGTKISHKQRREMLDKAKGFGGRFSSGSYL
ncbi:hypothetical protein K458DRAFT_306822 [Lentithecium fluviatile CBS 122367]|uniref:DUF3752 domain-containing protein n=1 Tax=Lentithecium fluviatile CBS 122367 TaxID=1168545 RepID=A0A6G1IWF6_9PLEO|nr:hypothetical protein K458DRAFT_306822 [Lentithecium fluviatile CBS 122367]